MQRSKSSVSVEVKQVIGALCRLLADSGLNPVPKPETFRRAKFGGGSEVEDQLWLLLSNILQRAGIEACVQFEGDQKRLVAAGLLQTGYRAGWMFREDGGDGERCSSRELLLALGWLLAAGTLEKLVSQRVQQLDKTLCTSTNVYTEFTKDLQIDVSSLRKLQWLVGSLRHQSRILMSMQEERTRLLHAVFLASLSSSSSSSNQSSAVLKDECVRVRSLCELLESYLNWKHVEKVFWTWMDSVVDSHLTDSVIVEKNMNTIEERARACHSQNRGPEKMEDMLLRLPTGQREQRRRKGDAVEEGQEGEKLLTISSSSSLPHLHSSSSSSSSSSSPSLLQVYRARFQTAGPVKHSSKPADRPCSSGAGAPDELPASQAAELLRQTEALLLERRDSQRLNNRMKLQDTFSRQDELVLIPP